MSTRQQLLARMHRLTAEESGEHVDLGAAPGAGNVGVKAMSLIYSALAGGDCIDDADLLRSGSTQAVLRCALRVPSTLGTFLRSFSLGHTRQLDVVSRRSLARAWSAGAGAGSSPLTIDLDSTICETYGLAKQGASRFTDTHVRGYCHIVEHEDVGMLGVWQID